MKFVWMDVDPGHDDATAILLAINCPNITLLGISTTHGNASSDWTMRNAARCLHAFGASSRYPDIRVYPGAARPLLRPAKHDSGDPLAQMGSAASKDLPDSESPEVTRWLAKDADGEIIRALDGMARAVKDTWNRGKGHQVSIISSGPMTNIALFVAVYPDLLVAVEEFVFMGGGVGLGNRSAVAEYNILCDPHAAQLVLDAPVKKAMIPINVTHTAIVTRAIHAHLLDPGTELQGDSVPLPKATTNLRHTLSTLISFFADSYKSTFGFEDGPPLHDALTVAYVSQPELFKSTRYRVDVELTGTHSSGETVVDMWNYQSCDEDAWGAGSKNCIVTQSVDLDGFFAMFHDCIGRCDQLSPLNFLLPDSTR
ncbi:Inosine/uridine-preferring nucleoside hydrolase domain-containing protein [Mycena filopes]|nr:Inosine/uridine-preferring nucleoside hydrolase domain-containing protein [Mycena filopes]